MTRVLANDARAFTNAGAVLGFDRPADAGWDPGFNRYLTIAGEPAYLLGGVCQTCSFLFERLPGANRKVSAEAITERLHHGLSAIESSVTEALADLVPSGNYVVTLLELQPTKVTPGSANDYFVNEQLELWGMDPFWGLPHYPRTEYYRVLPPQITGDEGLFEFLVPMYPSNWLDREGVTSYTRALAEGERPTAVALSVLDVRQPANRETPARLTKHWCLAHYLIDGHHKTFAAAQAGTPITLLSLLAVDQCVASRDEIDWLFRKL